MIKKVCAVILVCLGVILSPGLARAVSGVVDPAYATSPLVVTSASKSLTGTVGQYFSASFQVAGGTPNYSWVTEPALPAGLYLTLVPDAYTQCISPSATTDVQTNTCPAVYTSGQNATVSGVPTQAGSYSIKFVVADSVGHKTAVGFTFTIQSPGSSRGITVTAPRAGDAWQLGSTYTILWQDETGSALARPVTITLEPYVACLYSSPPCAVQQIAPYTIISSTTLPGYFHWTVPTSLASRYQTAVRVVVTTTDGALSGTSGVFKIANSSTLTPVRTGYVDSASATKIEGWAFDQTNQPTCVTIAYQKHGTGTNISQAVQQQSVCPSVNRVDAEDWLRKSFGSSINTVIQQPLGFVANPSSVLTAPGIYSILSVTLTASGVALQLSDAATKVFTIGSTQIPVAITGYVPAATVGQAFEMEFRASGGTNRGFVWQLASGLLPPGLALSSPETFHACDPLPGQQNVCPDNTERWRLVGIPTTAGSYTFQIKASDNQGGVGFANFTVTVSGGQVGSLVLSSADSLHVVVGQKFSKRFTVSGGTVPYSWTVDGLPTGVALTFPTFNCITTPCVAPKDEGYIGGIIAASGSYPFTVKVVDAQGRSQAKTFTFAAVSTGSQGPITITSPAGGEAWVSGKQYTLSWTGSNNLPVRITLEQYIPCLYTEPACKIAQQPGVVIVDNLAANAFAWNIPTSIPSGQYRVSLQTVASGVDYVLWGASGPFSIYSTNIQPQSLTITSPQKDEAWGKGKTYTIRWAPSAPGTTVNIYASRYIACLHNTTYVCAVAQPAPVTIAAGVADSGLYTWTIPADFNLSGPATILISNNSNGSGGESHPFQITDTTPTACPIAPGTLVVGRVGTVYIITATCSKYGFISYQDFVSRGYKFSQVQKVDQVVLDSVPTVTTFARAGGISFKYEGRPAVYYLTHALCKQVYPSLATLRAWKVGTRDIVVFPSSEQYSDCSPNFVGLPENTPTRAFGDGTVYVIRTGIRYPFASLGAFYRAGFTFRQIVVIPPAELDFYPLGGALE